MTSNARNWLTIGVTLLISSLCTFGYLGYTGYSDDALRVLLRLGARLGFGIYALIFVIRPLHAMFRTPMTGRLMRHRRQIGLAFGTIMMVHFGLIMTRLISNPEFSLGVSAIFGAFIYLLIFLMMLTSFDVPARLIGTRAWRVLHKTGLYLAGYAFASTLLPESKEQLFEPEYVAFTVLIAFALIVRLTAFLARRK